MTEGLQLNGKFAMTVFAGAFTAWAAVVAWGVKQVTAQIDDLHI